MSGGSYNYLCRQSACDLFSGTYRDELLRMANRLEQRFGAKDAAEATKAVLRRVQDFENALNVETSRLADVWHAVEWHDSSDYGANQVLEAIHKYRGDACPKCKGRGEINVSKQEYVYMGATCLLCAGSGAAPAECPTCATTFAPGSDEDGGSYEAQKPSEASNVQSNPGYNESGPGVASTTRGRGSTLDEEG